MDLKSFAEDFMESVQSVVEMGEATFEEELTSSIIEYIIDSGEVNSPEICTFRKTKAAIHAFDFNVDGNSLDLFILVPAEKALGKINNNKVDDGFNRLSAIYREAINGTLLKNATATDEISEVADIIRSTKGEIESLRLFVLTNGLVENYQPAVVQLEDGLIIEHSVWDMQRIYQQNSISAGREHIEIDFQTVYNTELQCLKINAANPDVDAYLAIIPGITLAQIYKQYKHALLEKNVRTFLQFKAKVNRAIRDTIKEQPDMFFSYNNGISTTASEIETRIIDGSLFITRLVDWQIVNGGQTTASIAATYEEKGVDLTKVFVPMKISIIPDPEKAETIIPQISTSANSQTAVKQSDFSANDPYLVALENFSRQIWVPNGNAKSITKWYFERTRGQYLDELTHLSGFNEKQFRTCYPKQHRISKTEIAKYLMCWEQQPEIVCRGAEKNYTLFVKLIKENTPSVSEVYYKRLIAKAILFKTIDKIVKVKQLGGYKSNVNAYTLSALSVLSKKQLDLDYIWEHQDVQPSLYDLLNQIIDIVWEVITNPQPIGSNVGEWTKKADCWKTLKLKLDGLTVPQELLLSPEKMIDDSLSAAQKNLIEEIWAIEANTWFAIAKWAKEHNLLTPLQRKMAFSFGKQKEWNKVFSFKQAHQGQKILKTVKENGFDA